MRGARNCAKDHFGAKTSFLAPATLMPANGECIHLRKGTPSIPPNWLRCSKQHGIPEHRSPSGDKYFSILARHGHGQYS
eukprot:scaffold10748_cov104-Skeletonema_dohrnii-CCMP3373.AAC.4